MKKYLALVLVLVMALGLFAACDNTEPAGTTAPKGTEPAGTTAPAATDPQPKDPVTLVWHIRGVGTQVDHDKVQDEFNKLLQSRPGFEHITVKLIHNLSSEHAATVERAFTAKEQIDIICTVNLTPVDMARDGYFVGLSEYFENHKTLWETYPEWLWETQYVDDDYYVVPNYQRGHNPKCWYIRSDIAAMEGVDWEGFKALVKWENGKSVGTADQILAKMEEMMLAAQAGGYEGYMPSPNTLVNGYNQNFFWHEYLDNLTPTGVGAFASHLDAKVNSLWLTEEMKTIWKYAAKWSDLGWFPADVTTAETGTYDYNKGSYFIGTTQVMDWDEELMDVTIENSYPAYDWEVFRHVDKVYMENRWAANGNAISSTCENPEDAVAFLELLGTDVELYNMLVYGLEGQHWEWVNKETNQIKTLDYDGSQASGQAPYGMLKWCVGNTFNAYLNQGCSLTENESALYLNENGVPAPWAGLKIDLTEFNTEIANCKAVESEWGNKLQFGLGGEAAFEANYAGFIEALKGAGLEKILESCQEQIDDYIASRG